MQKREKNRNLFKMKFIGFALFVSLLFSANIYAQTNEDYRNAKVSLKVENMTLGQVLDTLGSIVDVKFFYNHLVRF